MRYSNLISQYNEEVDKANASGAAPDFASLLLKREKLVKSTREALAAAVSNESMVRLDGHVQREKTRMKAPMKEGQ